MILPEQRLSLSPGHSTSTGASCIFQIRSKLTVKLLTEQGDWKLHVTNTPLDNYFFQSTNHHLSTFLQHVRRFLFWLELLGKHTSLGVTILWERALVASSRISSAHTSLLIISYTTTHRGHFVSPGKLSHILAAFPAMTSLAAVLSALFAAVRRVVMCFFTSLQGWLFVSAWLQH